ncbi:retrovirus-related pol polyprotein from transposon TNT 1-94, partial [Tanacetum coccineum]
GTEFVNQTLKTYYEDVAISHQTLVERTLQWNGVVERQNRTLVEAARTMLIFSKAPLYLWPEAVATTCYTHNRSLIHKCQNKTPYELLHDRKPDLKYFHIFGVLCYPTNDNEDLALIPANTTGTPSSTSINQDAPYVSTSPKTYETQSPVNLEGVEEQLQPAHFDNDPFQDILTSEPSS